MDGSNIGIGCVGDIGEGEIKGITVELVFVDSTRESDCIRLSGINETGMLDVLGFKP